MLDATMTEQLRRLSHVCDGVRCDMAMLVLPDVIERTWGEHRSYPDGATPVSTSFWAMRLLLVRLFAKRCGIPGERQQPPPPAPTPQETDKGPACPSALRAGPATPSRPSPTP